MARPNNTDIFVVEPIHLLLARLTDSHNSTMKSPGRKTGKVSLDRIGTDCHYFRYFLFDLSFGFVLKIAA